MEQRLFVLLLFTGVLPHVLPVSCKYSLIQDGKTWSEAQAYCRATYTDLATIDSNDGMVKLQDEAQTHQFVSSAWIGLYTNINSWHWSRGSEPLETFMSWSRSEPNNMLGNEQCVFILYGVWYDAPCDMTAAFVCFDAGTDSYIFISELMSWYVAQSYCRQQYTNLASARNATENSVVAGMRYWNNVWIGLRRDAWKWSDQTTNVSITNWQSGSVDDYLKNKSCGYLSTSRVGVALCSDIMPFFCYLFPNQLQIIRVKVKSSQDVNDPAIMAAMLEKIKQKLTDHGMAENIIVKWIKLPDGVVFHKENNVTVVNNTRRACDLKILNTVYSVVH